MLIFLGIFDAIIVIFAFAYLKETRGLSFEAIAHEHFNPSNSPKTAPDKDNGVFSEHHEN